MNTDVLRIRTCWIHLKWGDYRLAWRCFGPHFWEDVIQVMKKERAHE